MVARSPEQPHRTATELELFFDLAFVVAVAQASASLQHALAAGHLGAAALGYVPTFFAIWWAWMNFTWFASAYDNDDIPYRLATLVQIAGVLILAAGVPRLAATGDATVTTAGYVVMRLAMVAQWLRAARGDPERRASCLRYATGIALLQALWVLRLALHDPGWRVATLLLLGVAELAVPVVAERGARPTFHPRHIAERYGLFTLIVLGESLLAATLAVQSAIDAHTALGGLAEVAAGGLLTVFAMWWYYFAGGPGRRLDGVGSAVTWGYGHFLVFSSAAAVGAGLAVNVDLAVHHAEVGALGAAASFTVPVAVYVLTVWALQAPPSHAHGWRAALAPVVAAAVLAATFAPHPVLVAGLVVAAATALKLANPPTADMTGNVT
jgi:low temperature requirement protein LtrA